MKEYLATLHVPTTNQSRPNREHDPVNFPVHYNSLGAICSCGRNIECLDITRHLNFNLGNAIKYLWRSEHKGKRLEDLKKAIFYINDEVERLEKAEANRTGLTEFNQT